MQIPVSKSSIPYLDTVTPFKGIWVYMRSAMGMSVSFELTSHVLGDLIQEVFVIVIADDLHVCGNTVPEIFHNWSLVLHCMHKNNLKLSASKIVICPKHMLSPLCTAAPPKTCTAMQSYIGAYKAMSRCIPRYASLLSPLEDSVKGLQGSQETVWFSELLTHFKRCHKALNPILKRLKL